jgi:hypothetical protein
MEKEQATKPFRGTVPLRKKMLVYWRVPIAPLMNLQLRTRPWYFKLQRHRTRLHYITYSAGIRCSINKNVYIYTAFKYGMWFVKNSCIHRT